MLGAADAVIHRLFYQPATRRRVTAQFFELVLGFLVERTDPSVTAERQGCRSYHKGKTAGANCLQLRMNEADDSTLEQLRDYVLQAAIVEVLADAVALLRSAASELDAPRAELEQRAHDIDGELALLVTAVAAGGQLASLVAAMKERGLLRAVGQLDVKRVERDLRERIKKWRSLLGMGADGASD